MGTINWWHSEVKIKNGFWRDLSKISPAPRSMIQSTRRSRVESLRSGLRLRQAKTISLRGLYGGIALLDGNVSARYRLHDEDALHGTPEAVIAVRALPAECERGNVAGRHADLSRGLPEDI